MRSSAEGAALVAAALLACSVTSPETEVREALGRLGAVDLGAAGPASVRLERTRFADVAVSMDGPRALVLAVVEADGRVGGGDGPALAYIGREAFAMERCPVRRWCIDGGGLPALRGVVAALRDAPRQAGARVVAWQVRVERNDATAGEDYEAGGRRLRVRRGLRRDGETWGVIAVP